MLKFLVSIFFLSGFTPTDTAKILAVFPAPSISHHLVFRKLTEELAHRGHEVVVITPYPAFKEGKAPPNLTEIDVHEESTRFFNETIVNVLKNQELGKESKYVTQVKEFESIMNVFEVQIKTKQVQKMFREKRHFDLLLIEPFIIPTCIMSYIYKAPMILVSSFGAMLENLEAVGAPTHPFFYPIPYRRRTYNLSRWDKIREWLYYMQHIYYLRTYTGDERLRETIGQNVPSINELMNNVDMLIVNNHPIWMDNIPAPSNAIFIGGLHQEPFKEIPQDLKSYLDSSKNGVIYVSFGSNIRPMMLPAERVNILIDSLSELKYDVLLKWNDDELPVKAKNIKISKWLPQSDLLRHPKIKAFVTQGGLQSTDEAITAAVPLICLPMFSDQWFNAEKYVKLKIGIKLDFTTFTKAQFKNSVDTVIADTSYRENIVRLRNQMHDQPEMPLERAVRWIEYVIRHNGARHLRSPAANMSWSEYYELELVLTVLLVIIFTISVVSYIFLMFGRYIGHIKMKNFKMKGIIMLVVIVVLFDYILYK